MPSIHLVKKSYKDQGTCRCGTPLERGTPYQWIKFRHGGMHKLCMSCTFRPSDLTQSKMSEAYAAQEAAQDYVNGWDGDDIEDVRSQLTDAAEQIRAVGEEYREAADAIRENFEESPTADDCEEKAEALESWADEIDSSGDDLDEYDGEVNADGEPDDPEERSAWVEDVRCNAASAIDECPL